MDDAARRAEEIVEDGWRRWNLGEDMRTRLEPGCLPRSPEEYITDALATALREVEKYLEAERTMRILLANDSQRHLEAYIQRGKRLARVEAALEIETLRDYHNASFADPPSYHLADATTLWDCAMCVEKYIERIPAALTPDATTEGTDG